MRTHSIRKLVMAVLALVLIVGFLLVDSSAQRRRRRRRTSSAPRIENPAIYQPSPADNTAGDASKGDINTDDKPRASGHQDPDATRKTIRGPSTHADKVHDKTTEMYGAQRSL